ALVPAVRASCAVDAPRLQPPARSLWRLWQLRDKDEVSNSYFLLACLDPAQRERGPYHFQCVSGRTPVKIPKRGRSYSLLRLEIHGNRRETLPTDCRRDSQTSYRKIEG